MEVVSALIIIAIIVIFIFLILKDTDCVQIAKQVIEIAELRIENNKLKESNAELRDEYCNYLILKYECKSTLINIKSDLKHIQELSTTNMTDKEIIHERYIAIENTLKDLNGKLKELDCLNQPNSN